MKRSIGFFAHCGWLTSGTAGLIGLTYAQCGAGSSCAAAAADAPGVPGAFDAAADDAPAAAPAARQRSRGRRRRGRGHGRRIGPACALIDPGADQGELLRGQRIFLERHLVLVRDRAGGTKEALQRSESALLPGTMTGPDTPPFIVRARVWRRNWPRPFFGP